MPFVLVAMLGAVVGATELMSRYRDAPFLSIATWGSGLYIGVNAFAALAALFLLDTFGQQIVAAYGDGLQKDAARVMIAGFGAVAFMRSSLFRIRVDQADVDIGPSAVLDVLLRVADRDVDRSRALDRADKIPEVMASMNARVACTELPALCLALMQNLSTDEQRALGDQVTLIAENKSLSDVGKAVNTGLLLSRFIGFGVLSRAVKSINERPPESGKPSEVKPVDPALVQDIKRDLALDRGAPSG